MSATPCSTPSYMFMGVSNVPPGKVSTVTRPSVRFSISSAHFSICTAGKVDAGAKNAYFKVVCSGSSAAASVVSVASVLPSSEGSASVVVVSSSSLPHPVATRPRASTTTTTSASHFKTLILSDMLPPLDTATIKPRSAMPALDMKCQFDCTYSRVNCTNGHLLAVSYTHLRAHETKAKLVCRLLLE